MALCHAEYFMCRICCCSFFLLSRLWLSGGPALIPITDVKEIQQEHNTIKESFDSSPLGPAGRQVISPGIYQINLCCFTGHIINRRLSAAISSLCKLHCPIFGYLHSSECGEFSWDKSLQLQFLLQAIIKQEKFKPNQNHIKPKLFLSTGRMLTCS